MKILSLVGLLFIGGEAMAAPRLRDRPDYDVKQLNGARTIVLVLDQDVDPNDLYWLLWRRFDLRVHWNDNWMFWKREKPLTAVEWAEIRKLPGVEKILALDWEQGSESERYVRF